jgi:hypothetical protein
MQPMHRPSEGAHRGADRSVDVTVRVIAGATPVASGRNLAETQERLRAVRLEIEGERRRLARPSPVRLVVRWAVLGGLAVFVAGWFPVDTWTSSDEPSISAAHVELLARARAARDPDGKVVVTVIRRGKPLSLPLRELSVFSPGTPEEKRYVLAPKTPVVEAQETESSATPSDGWIFKTLDEDSETRRAGFELGDVITAFGDTPVPVVVHRRTLHRNSSGLDELKLAGVATIVFGMIARRLRLARLRRLQRTAWRLRQQIDAAMRTHA